MPFHQVLLSSLDDNFAASDLFGHLSGSYTGAEGNRPGHFVTANHGPLFLDEIGKASPSVQRKLLHAIEHREIWPVGADRSVRLDVRIVAASNIPALVRQFAALRAVACGHPLGAPKFDDALLAALGRAEWPYNLRQLDGVVQRLLMEGALQGVRELSLAQGVGELAWRRVNEAGSRMPSREAVRVRYRELGSKAAVARSFGISRWTVDRYLKHSVKAGSTPAAERAE
jgi:DNA-binding NtrC family response regulator